MEWEAFSRLQDEIMLERLKYAKAPISMNCFFADWKLNWYAMVYAELSMLHFS